MENDTIQESMQWLEEVLPSLLEPKDVILVNMPYCDIDLPSLALGLLQSVLLREQIPTKTLYANLLFSEIVGCERYKRTTGRHFGGQPIHAWSFSGSAFPDFAIDENQFVEKVENWAKQLKDEEPIDLREEMLYLRRAAEAFTDILAQEIVRMSPRIVGCSSSLNQRVPTLALFRKIRELDPSIITLMGGADCETIMGYTTHKHFPWVDYTVSGEGEELLTPLVKLIFKYGKDVPMEQLPLGVLGPVHRRTGYLSPDLKTDRAVAATFMEQLTPDYHDYFHALSHLKEVRETAKLGLSIQSSRGCWHGKCKWCGLNAPKIPYRSRPAEVVLAEMDELYETYGYDRIEFLDTILDNRFFDDLIPALMKRENKFKLFMEVRSGLSREQFRMLQAAGVMMCQPGIESLHTSALKTMVKGVKAWQNIETLKWCRQYGISPYWSILYDFPHDDDDWYYEMADLVPLLTHLNPPSNVNLVQFQPNSHYVDHAQEYNLNLKADPLEALIYPLSMEIIKDISPILHDDYYTARRTKGSYLAALYVRPGVQKLKKEVAEWMKLANSENEPVLSMKEEEDTLLITDTRPVAVAQQFTLTGLERDITLDCIETKLETKVIEEQIKRGNEAGLVADAIESLIKSKVLLRVDGRLMTLAVEEPFMEYMEYYSGYKRHNVLKK